MKKNTKIILSVLGVGVVITAIVLIFKKIKEDEINKQIKEAGNTEEDIFDKDLESYNQYFVSSFNPIELATTDAAFKGKVEELQRRLNNYIKSNPKDRPPTPILKVDGQFGLRTMRAIVWAFGDRLLPLRSASQIDYFINNLIKWK